MRRAAALVLGLALACSVSGCFLVRGLATRAGLTRSVSPELLSEALRPYDEWFVPEGPGPFPTVVIAPGCLGTRSHHRDWARFFVDEGLAAVIVDSFVPRGYADTASRQRVCGREALWGFVRAGDLWVTLADLMTNPLVDSEHVVLAGWSNGAWAVMDALSMDRETNPPPTLDPVPKAGLSSVRAAILFYPYCGFGSASKERGWSHPVPALMLLAEQDETLPPGQCEETAASLAARDVPIDRHTYAGATHWFDHDADMEWVPHRFDAELLADARLRIRVFLTTALPGAR